MSEAVTAYKSVTVSPEFREIERVRELARHNEAAALDRAAEKAISDMSKYLLDVGVCKDAIEMALKKYRQ
jgi:hypothetical protein